MSPSLKKSQFRVNHRRKRQLHGENERKQEKKVEITHYFFKKNTDFPSEEVTLYYANCIEQTIRLPKATIHCCAYIVNYNARHIITFSKLFYIYQITRIITEQLVFTRILVEIYVISRLQLTTTTLKRRFFKFDYC